jgi:hypothetical protein
MRKVPRYTGLQPASNRASSAAKGASRKRDGATLDAVADDRGGVFVSVRRVCDALGLAVQPQLAKLWAKPWATVTFIVTVAEDGKNRETAMLDLDALPMWLATIEPSRVAPEAREKLVLYQREAARVLRDHFFGPRSIAQRDVKPENISPATSADPIDAFLAAQLRAACPSPRLGCACVRCAGLTSRALVAGLGLVVAAMYLLIMLGKLVWGPLREPHDHSHGHGHGEGSLPKDLSAREIGILVPLAVVCLAIGFYPKPMLEAISPSVDKVLAQYPKLVEQYAKNGTLLTPADGAAASVARTVLDTNSEATENAGR